MKITKILAVFVIVLSFVGCARKKQPSRAHIAIDDFSHLNQTTIKHIYTPENYVELAAIVRSAAQNGLKISVAGAQHSQGGHTFYPDGIVIRLKKFNQILDINHVNKTMTVQTGATWKEVQDRLNPHNLAVKIMQFINMVTVGGALSVNANGIDPHCGPFIESIRALKIMRADGAIITASRTENAELFALAIGGYGLFGIILEATLDIVENAIYKRESQCITLEEYQEHIKALVADVNIGFNIGQLVLDPQGTKLFKGIESIYYTKVDEQMLSLKKIRKIKKMHKERFVPFKKIGISLLRSSVLAKKHQKAADSARNGMLLSRNNIMSPPASHVYHDLTKQTDLLQQYFIPIKYFVDFMKLLEGYTRVLKVNLMHVNVRFIPKNTESFLSYLNHDSIGVVLFFAQNITEHDSRITKMWTQLLIDAAIKYGGTYYLPIQLHADHKQIRQCYPQLDTFFELKRKYDPQEIFVNHFYKKYALSDTE